MPRHVINAVALVAFVTMVGLGLRWFSERKQASDRASSSDAASIHTRFKIGIDSWVGYAPLCGDEMADRLAVRGLGLECVDDGADYEKRFKALRSGQLDLAVTSIDAYLRDQSKRGEIGPLVAVLDESAGGDAIVARKDVAKDLKSLADPAPQARRVAFTGGSPSEFLLMAAAEHFGIPFFQPERFIQVQTDGSATALKALRGGKADIAVLWEPDVSAALKDDRFHKLLGTEDTAGLIVDALVASPAFLAQSKKELLVILEVYFGLLDFYEANAARRNADLAARLKVKASDVEPMIQGVRWASLAENAMVWFNSGPDGYGEKRLLATLHSTQDVLFRAGAVSAPSIASAKALEMIYSSSIERLLPEQMEAKPAGAGFTELSDTEWRALREVASIKIEPITFQPGTFLLTDGTRADLDRVAEILSLYPRYRLVVRGHTSDAGEAQANLELSSRRAQAVAEYLTLSHPVDINRVRAEGYGGQVPPAQLPGESLRAWRYRQARVEIAFVGDKR